MAKKEFDNLAYLFEQMNDDAFSFCRKLVFPVCNFKYYKIEELRKVDLLERSIYLREQYKDSIRFKKFSYKPKGECADYVEGLKFYLNTFVGNSSSERVLSYTKRAKEIIDNMIATDSFPTEDIESAIIVFLAVLKNIRTDDSDHKKYAYIINNANFFSLDETDGQTLEKIRVTDNLTPEEFIPKDLQKRFYGKRDFYDYEYRKFRARKDFYHYITSIYLSLALQEKGIFA